MEVWILELGSSGGMVRKWSKRYRDLELRRHAAGMGTWRQVVMLRYCALGLRKFATGIDA